MMKFFSVFPLLICFMSAHAALNETEKPSVLNVYIDQNLPYSGFDANQKAQGVVVDYWQLWSTQSDIAVNFHPYNNESLFYLLNSNPIAIYSGLLAKEQNLASLEKELLFDFKADFYYLSSHKQDIEHRIGLDGGALIVGGLFPRAQQILVFGNNTQVVYKEYPGLLDLFVDIYSGKLDAFILFNSGQGVRHIVDRIISLLFEKSSHYITSKPFFVYVPIERELVLDWINWGNQLEQVEDNTHLLLENAENPIWGVSKDMATKLFVFLFFMLLVIIFSHRRRRKDKEFKNILDSSPYPLAIFSLDGQDIYYLNNELKSLFSFHYKKNKYLFEDIENQQQLSSFINKASHLVTIDEQRLHILVDGSFHDVEISAKRVHYKGKTAWFCYFKDVTALLRAERELTEERELLRKVLDSIPEQISFKSSKGTIIGCNKAWATAHNTTVNHATGRRIADMLPAHVIEKQKRQEVNVWLGEIYNKQEWINENYDTSSLVNFVKLPLYNDKGAIFAVLSIDSDITDFYNLNEQLKEEHLKRLEAEKSLSVQHSLLRRTLEVTDDALVMLDQAGRITVANKCFAKLINVNMENLIGLSVSDVFSDGRADWIERENQLLIESGSAHTFEEFLFVDGEKRCYQIEKNAFHDQDNDYSGIVITARDITSQKQHQEKQQLASVQIESKMVNDQLTGIANRDTFELQFKQLWQDAYQEEDLLTLIVCDIDCFKAYCDNYGVLEGDQLIKHISHVLEKFCIQFGCFVARYDIDKFVIITKGGNATNALKLAENIRMEVVSEKIEHLYSSVNRIVTLSMGLSSLFPSDLNSTKILLAEAEGALHIAKQTGKDQLYVH
ncbi:diguanylate cyclase [Psychromonas sp. MME1]|uniref:diguanylate cyclase domain-containing protein n=1 Tax=Psychromonas sp. MME1 TaxID=3231032 RepID=UPI0034E1E43B